MTFDNPQFRQVSHGNLGYGGYFYRFVKVDDPMLHLEIRKEGKAAEVFRYRHVLLPNMVFITQGQVREQLDALTSAEWEERTAQYPKLSCKPHGPKWGSKRPVPCTLCRSVGLTPPSTHYFVKVMSWVPGDLGHYANLCDAHAALPLEDLDVIVARMTNDRVARGND